MGSRRKITITPEDNIVVIKGYKVAEIAKAAGLRPTYSASAGGWMLDLRRLPELVAWLEYRNFRYEMAGTSEPESPPAAEPPDIPRPRVAPEPTLW